MSYTGAKSLKNTTKTSKTSTNNVSENTSIAAGTKGDVKYGSGKGSQNIRDSNNVFVATANDEARIAPLEKQTSSVALNEFTDFLTAFNTDLADLMSGAKGVLDFTKTAISKIKDVKQKIDNKDWMGMLSSVTGGSLPLLKQMGVDANIIEKMKDIDNIVVKAGQAYKRIENTDWKDVNSVLGLVGHFTKDNELFRLDNFGAEVSSMLEAINVLSSKGIPNVLSTFAEFSNLKNNYHSLLGLSRHAYTYAQRDTNLDLLKEIVDILGKETLVTIDGFLLERFLQNFKVPAYIKKDHAAYEAFFNSFLVTYGAVSSTWLFTPDDTVLTHEALNGVTFSKASKDFFEMINYFAKLPFSLNLADLGDTDAENIPFVFLMQGTNQTSIYSIVKETLPTATWVSNTQLSKAYKSVYDDYGIQGI